MESKEGNIIKMVHAVIGDETACAKAFFKGDNATFIKEGNVVAIRNGKKKFIKDYISLEVDMFGRITQEQDEITTVNDKINISEEEHKLEKIPMRNNRGKFGQRSNRGYRQFRDNRGYNGDRGFNNRDIRVYRDPRDNRGYNRDNRDNRRHNREEREYDNRDNRNNRSYRDVQGMRNNRDQRDNREQVDRRDNR